MSVCDNASVGVLIAQGGRWLLFERVRPPHGIAPVAGHIDSHGDPEDAARAEVAEEVGLTVVGLQLVTQGWRENACRRVSGTRGIGHEWSVFRAEVSGTVTTAPDETRNARWLTGGEIQALADRTVAYARGEVPEVDWQSSPGLEPVWVGLLAELRMVSVGADALAAVDWVASRPPVGGAR